MRVSLRNDETLDILIGRFRSRVTREGVIGELKRHQTFSSRGEWLRAKVLRAQRKRLSRFAKPARGTARAA